MAYQHGVASTRPGVGSASAAAPSGGWIRDGRCGRRSRGAGRVGGAGDVRRSGDGRRVSPGVVAISGPQRAPWPRRVRPATRSSMSSVARALVSTTPSAARLHYTRAVLDEHATTAGVPVLTSPPRCPPSVGIDQRLASSVGACPRRASQGGRGRRGAIPAMAAAARRAAVRLPPAGRTAAGVLTRWRAFVDEYPVRSARLLAELDLCRPAT